MSIPTFKTPLIVQTNESWVEDFAFYLSDDTEPESFVGCTLAAAIERNNNSFALGPYLSVSGNVVSINVPKATMQNLAPGLYSFDMRVTRPTTVVEVLCRGKVQIDEGVS